MNKPKKNRRNYIEKPKVSKKLIMSTIASVLVLAITATLVWNASKVSVPVEAETLSGVPDAIKDHGSDKPFVILNIVADNNDGYVGSMGYLTVGQSPVERELQDNFRNGNTATISVASEGTVSGNTINVENYNLINYSDREQMAIELGRIYGVGSDYKYEESLTGGTGWSKIFDGAENSEFKLDEADTYYKSIITGAWKHVGTGAGEYLLLKDIIEANKASNTYYIASDISSFALSEEAVVEGYTMKSSEEIDVNAIEHGEDDDMSVYMLDNDGKYIYYGLKSKFIDDINADKATKEQYEKDLETFEKLQTEFDDAWEKYRIDTEAWETKQKEAESNPPAPAQTESNVNSISQDSNTPQVNTTPETTDNQNGEGETKTEATKSESGEGDIVSLGWMKFVAESDVESQTDEVEINEVDNQNAEGEAGGSTVGGIDEENKEGDVEGTNKPDGEGDGDGEGEGTNKPDGEGDGDGEGTNKPDGEGGGEEPKKPDGESGEEGTDKTNKPDEENTPPAPDETEEPDMDKPIEPDLEKPKKPDDPTYKIIDKEDKYLIIEFAHYEKTENDGKMVEGLYVPISDYETAVYEDVEAVALYDDGNDAEEHKIDKDKTLIYVGANRGDYTITEGKDKLLVYNAPTYFRCYDRDLLKEYVFESNAFNVQVKVKPAVEVTPDDVKSADLIYLEDAGYIYSGNDMSDQTALSIIEYAVDDLRPVILDYEISNGGKDKKYSADSNYQKLANILMLTDLYSYYIDMEENIDNILMNPEPDKYSKFDDIDGNWVNNNIYVIEGSHILQDRANFTTPFDEGEMESLDGFQEVKSAIEMEIRQNGKDKLLQPCRAMAIQYIINYANGFIGEFRNFTVLELQATEGESDLNQRTDTKNNTIFYWRRPGSIGSGQQILRSRNLIDIKVENESVMQFSGEQSDINNKYQMVFIGLDGQSLNYEKKETVYNSLERGIVYSGVGDTSDGGQYEGIDITEQKKNALLDFLKAGYPIVVENDFFTNKSAKDAGVGDINPKYVSASSQMYDFLRIALSSEDYKWCLYTIADVHMYSSDFAAQINVYRPKISFDGENSDDNRIQTIYPDALDGKYRGYIQYKVTNDIDEGYSNAVDTHFYLDMNQDGRFDVTEEVTENVAIGGGMVAVEFAAAESGSIPWKLEVCDVNNSYRRDSLTGYFNIRKSTNTPIRVVQIVGGNGDEALDASFNLEEAYTFDDGTSKKTLLGYYLQGVEALTNTTLEIESITVGQLAAELALNERYLTGADVLVLGFGADRLPYNLSYPIAGRDKDVAGYVNEYISEGRGVLVSSAASSELFGRMQLDVGALGQKTDIRTYNSLGKAKSGATTYYQYATLKSNMFGPWDRLSAVQVNDGTVSHYPYDVGSSVSIRNTGSTADYVLDFTANGKSDTVGDVTAWYCLNSSDSSYGVSPKDAANNYYIYSKGNVVYLGDSSFGYTYEGDITEDIEGTVNCKLFVNALMQAYSVGIKNPKVSIVAGLSDDAADTDSICIPYDEQIVEVTTETEGVEGTSEVVNGSILDDTVDVYFKITEPNLAFTKDVTLTFYYEDNIYGTPVDVGGKVVKATPFASEIWTVEENQLVSVPITSGLDLVPGKVYKIKAPVVSLVNEGDKVNADIYVVVQSRFFKLGAERTPVGSDSVTLSRAQLFLLE